MADKLSLLLIAVFGVAACSAETPARNEGVASKQASAPARADPVGVAQRLVRQRLGGNTNVRFGEARTYRDGGVAVVCGSYAQPGAAELRFVAVTDLDVWLEPEMGPGEMDRAFAEFCRDGVGNA